MIPLRKQPAKASSSSGNNYSSGAGINNVPFNSNEDSVVHINSKDDTSQRMNIATDRMILEGNVYSKLQSYGTNTFCDLSLSTEFCIAMPASVAAGDLKRSSMLEFEYCKYTLHFNEFNLELGSGISILPSLKELQASSLSKTTRDHSITLQITSKSASGSLQQRFLILRPYSHALYLNWHRLLRECIVESCFHDVFRPLVTGTESSGFDLELFPSLINAAIKKCNDLVEDSNIYLTRLNFTSSILIEIKEMMEVIAKYGVKNEDNRAGCSLLIGELDDLISRALKEPLLDYHGQISQIKKFHQFLVKRSEMDLNSSKMNGSDGEKSSIMSSNATLKPKPILSCAPGRKSFQKGSSAAPINANAALSSSIPSCNAGSIESNDSDSNKELLNRKDISTSGKSQLNVSNPIFEPLEKVFKMYKDGSPSVQSNANSTSSSSKTTKTPLAVGMSTPTHSLNQLAISETCSDKHRLIINSDIENIDPEATSPIKGNNRHPTFLNTSLLVSKPLTTKESVFSPSTTVSPLTITNRSGQVWSNRPPLKKISISTADSNSNSNINSNSSTKSVYPSSNVINISGKGSASEEPAVVISSSTPTSVDSIHLSRRIHSNDSLQSKEDKSVDPLALVPKLGNSKQDVQELSPLLEPKQDEINKVEEVVVRGQNKCRSWSLSNSDNECHEHIQNDDISCSSDITTCISREGLNTDASRLRTKRRSSLKRLKLNLLTEFDQSAIDLSSRKELLLSILNSKSKKDRDLIQCKTIDCEKLNLDVGALNSLISHVNRGPNHTTATSKSNSTSLETSRRKRGGILANYVISKALTNHYKQESKKYRLFGSFVVLFTFLAHFYLRKRCPSSIQYKSIQQKLKQLNSPISLWNFMMRLSKMK